MTALLDNITATIVGVAVLAMVVVMQQRAQEAGVQRSITYHAKKHTIELGRWLQDDMANVGAGVSFGNIAVTGHTENAEGLTTSFSFRRKINEADPAPSEIEYVLNEIKTVIVDDEEVQLYEIAREVDGVVVGKSPQTITSFSITMLDAGGEETNVPTEARQLRVQLSTALPFSDQKMTYLREAHWGTTVPLREL